MNRKLKYGIIIGVVGFIGFNIIGILSVSAIVNYDLECTYWAMLAGFIRELPERQQQFSEIMMWLGENCRV